VDTICPYTRSCIPSGYVILSMLSAITMMNLRNYSWNLLSLIEFSLIFCELKTRFTEFFIDSP